MKIPVLVMLLCILAFNSCKKNEHIKTITRYTVNVIVDKPIDNSLLESDEFKKMFLSIVAENCDSLVFVPNINIIRLDQSEYGFTNIPIPTLNDRKSQTANTKAIDNWIADALKKFKPSHKASVEYNANATNVPIIIDSIINSLQSTSIIAYNPNDNISIYKTMSHSIKYTHNINDLRDSISLKLCVFDEGKEQYLIKSGSPIIILFNLNTVLTDIENPGGNQPPIIDTDEDGIPDSIDSCPSIKGLPKNNGCPEKSKDQDSDGVSDYFDKCPDVFGSSANSGCPKESSGTTPRTECVNLPQPNSLISYFMEIGSNKYEYPCKWRWKEEVVKQYFTNGAVKAYIQTNNSITAVLSIEALLDTMAQQNLHISIVTSTSDNNGKISSITVKYVK